MRATGGIHFPKTKSSLENQQIVGGLLCNGGQSQYRPYKTLQAYGYPYYICQKPSLGEGVGYF